MKPLPLIIYTDMNSTILDFLLKKGYSTHTDRDSYLRYMYITALTTSDPCYDQYIIAYDLEPSDAEITGWNNSPDGHIDEADYLPARAFIRTFILPSQIYTRI